VHWQEIDGWFQWRSAQEEAAHWFADELKWPDVVRAVTDLLPDARPWSTGQWRSIAA